MLSFDMAHCIGKHVYFRNRGDEFPHVSLTNTQVYNKTWIYCKHYTKGVNTRAKLKHEESETCGARWSMQYGSRSITE